MNFRHRLALTPIVCKRAGAERLFLPLPVAFAYVATFANAFVGEFVLFDHDRTWLTCSVVLFVCACTLTIWTLARGLREAERTA